MELFTRKKSQNDKGDILSPTHSVKSEPSTSDSSERGWSSDPDTRHKMKPQQSLSEARDEWDQVETVTAGKNIKYRINVKGLKQIQHFMLDAYNEKSSHLHPWGPQIITRRPAL